MAGQRTAQLSYPDSQFQYTFQAGHAGSIPVIRSSFLPCSRDNFDSLSGSVRKLAVPHMCHLAPRPQPPHSRLSFFRHTGGSLAHEGRLLLGGVGLEPDGAEIMPRGETDLGVEGCREPKQGNGRLYAPSSMHSTSSPDIPARSARSATVRPRAVRTSYGLPGCSYLDDHKAARCPPRWRDPGYRGAAGRGGDGRTALIL